MRFYRTLLRKLGFSLLQAAVVLAVLGIVATIVGPRMSRGGAPSPRIAEQVLVGNLQSLRHAVRAYASDHAGRLPSGDPRQLVQFTDQAGHPSPVRTLRHRWGPYLREIPPLPVGAHRGATTFDHVAVRNSPAGWLYDPVSGNVIPNTHSDECDMNGRAFRSY
jgi:type II secretory pathway pseudopilin PulG